MTILAAFALAFGALVLVYVASLPAKEPLPTSAPVSAATPVPVVAGAAHAAPLPTRAEAPPAPAPVRKRTNILVLGVDQRTSEQGQPTRSDTMMVVTVDQKAGAAGVLSIPRDLYVSIPEWRDGSSTGATIQQKITTAHFWGDLWQYPGGGPALAARVVDSNLGIPLDYYMSVDFRAFERAIDAIGGITIDVEKPLVDYEFPDEEREGAMTTVRFEAGVQHMDGLQALRYARIRHPDSDFGRIGRQQQVVLAVRNKVLEPGTWLRLPALAQALYGSIRTNLPLPELLSLANIGRGINRERIVFRTIDTTMVTAALTSDGAQVLLPRWDSIREVVEEVFNGVPGG